MRHNRSSALIILSALGMIILIVDSKTAIAGANEGIDICIKAVIPSLFPLFILSGLLTNSISGTSIEFLRPVGRLCGIPSGAEYLLLSGILGGYPVGAQGITDAYHAGSLSKHDAHRLLGFCNNAGPAFIFGIAGTLFSSGTATLFLWFIHITSALLVAIILPKNDIGIFENQHRKSVSMPTILTNSLRITASVCGWIIIFRIIITFLNRWLFWLFPAPLKHLMIGTLELANGCSALFETQSEFLRFIICSIILSFGGLCVSMQTVSVTGALGVGYYFHGKLLQTLFSAMLSIPVAFYLYRKYTLINTLFLLPLVLLIFIICKKTVAFSENRIYNR